MAGIDLASWQEQLGNSDLPSMATLLAGQASRLEGLRNSQIVNKIANLPKIGPDPVGCARLRHAGFGRLHSSGVIQAA
jgi:hypothetical protein